MPYGIISEPFWFDFSIGLVMREFRNLNKAHSVKFKISDKSLTASIADFNSLL